MIFLINNTYHCDCYKSQPKEEKPKGYIPSIERILGSETLSLSEKNELLKLYHDKYIKRTDVEYIVDNYESKIVREKARMAKKAGKQLATIYKTDEDQFYRIFDSFLDNI